MYSRKIQTLNSEAFSKSHQPESKEQETNNEVTDHLTFEHYLY